MADNLSKYFGVDEIRESLPAIQSESLSLENDSEMVKQNLKTLIETGNTALEEALNLAIASESPTAIVAFTSLLETLSKINSKIMDIHTKTVDIKNKTNQKNSENISQNTGQNTNNGSTNNIVFTGTTKELASFLSELKNNSNNVIDVKPKND